MQGEKELGLKQVVQWAQFTRFSKINNGRRLSGLDIIYGSQ